MSDNYDGPQMAQKIMRQQAEIERLRIKNARLRALLTKRLEFLEEHACEESEPECAWCQSHELWLEITHELSPEDSAADQPAAVCWACNGSGIVRCEGQAINCPECNPVAEEEGK